MTKKRWFITGTDTDSGKTVFATALLKACSDAGFLTAALKPVAAGGVYMEDGFFNEDEKLLLVLKSTGYGRTFIPSRSKTFFALFI